MFNAPPRLTRAQRSAPVILSLQELLRPLALVPVRTKLCASEQPALLPIVLPTLRAVPASRISVAFKRRFPCRPSKLVFEASLFCQVLLNRGAMKEVP